MKKLRVLTGRHAGSELPLDQVSCVISAQAEHDIQITDWTDPPITLTLHEQADSEPVVLVNLLGGDQMMLLANFAPVAFGSVALCVGPAIGAWPSDIELIETMLRPHEPEPAPSAASSQLPATPRRTGLVVAGFALAALLLAGFVAVVSGRGEPPPPPSPLAMTFKVVERFKVPEVSVRTEGKSVLVEGLVEDTETMNRLRQALAELPKGMVRERLASAADLAQTIADTLGASGISVRYLSRGEFLVAGSAVEASKLETSSQRLANELKPLVTAIRVSVQDIPLPPRMPTGAMLSADGVEYVQSRDGVKHIALTRRFDPAAPGASDSLFPQPRNSERSTQ